MRSQRHLRRSHRSLFLALLLVPVLLACSISTGTTTGGTGTTTGATPTATGGPGRTPTPAPCGTRATASAEAWVNGRRQVEGKINGGPVTTLSNFVYPLGFPSEDGDGGPSNLSYLAWAPDARHIAALAELNFANISSTFVYVVDTSSHAVTKILGDYQSYPGQAPDNTWARRRSFAWADSHTLLVFGRNNSGDPYGTTRSYIYDVTTSSLTPLPGVTTAVNGEVRCSMLYYLQIPPDAAFGPSGWSRGTGLLHRYSLVTHTDIGAAFTLGQTSRFAGNEGEMTAMGWDVARDNTHLVYQNTSVGISGSGLVTTSTFVRANPDGSGGAAILPLATANSTTSIGISPNNVTVAVTDAQPSPDIVSGPVAGGAPTRFYSPDATGIPAWLADSSGFDATVGDLYTPGGPKVENYPLAGAPAGTTKVANAHDPASLP